MARRERPHRLVFESLEHRRVLSSQSPLAEAAAIASLDPIRIQSFGDSLSTGIATGDAERRGITPRASYRPALWQLIEEQFVEGPHVEFVGSSTYNSTTLPDQAAGHSTYRGFTTVSFFPNNRPNFGSDPHGDINSSVHDADGWATLEPDVALIMMGTNDLLEGRLIVDLPRYPQYRSIETLLRTTIDTLRESNEQVTILLGTLPPYQGGTRVQEMNAVIRNLINPAPEVSWSGSTIASSIHIVDHYFGEGELPAFDLDLHSDDGVHPNVAGDELLAANWWSVLRPIMVQQDQAAARQPLVSMAASTLAVTEADGSTTHLVVNRVGDISSELSVPYEVSGNAENGADYVLTSEQVFFAAGQSQAFVGLTVVDDAVVEPEEQIVLRLIGGDRYDLGEDSATTITLTDDDAAVLPNVSIRSLTSPIAESVGTISVAEIARDGDLTEPLTVFYTLSGSALLGTDFAGPMGRAHLSSGQASTTVDITVFDDPRDEGLGENIVIELMENPKYVVSAARVAVLEILDDDEGPAPWVSVSAVDDRIVESSRGVTRFRVTRTGEATSDLVVEFETTGSATAGEDFIAPGSSLVIPAGSRSAMIDIALLDDALSEGDEFIKLQITPSIYYDIGLASDRATITDDEDNESLASFLSQFVVYNEFNTPILG